MVIDQKLEILVRCKDEGIVHGQTIHLPSLILVNALVGMVTGSVFGMLAKHSRIYRAHAKVVAGVVAGITVSIVFAMVHEVFTAFPLMLSIALMCLLTGATEVFLKLKAISPPGVESFNADEVGTFMAQGTAASSINWPNWVGTFEDPNQSRVVGKIAYSAIPSGSHAGSSEIGHWLMGIMADSKNKQAAFDFMVWATSPEQIKKSVERGNPPVRFSVFTDPELTSQHQFRHFPVLMEAISFSTPRPRHPKWPEIENAFGVELSKAVAGQIGAKEALERANAAIAKIIAR